MKKYILFFAAIVTLTACSQLELDEASGETAEKTQTKKFTFTVKGDFTAWQADAANSRRKVKNEYLSVDGTEMTDLWVVDVMNGEVVQQLHQTPDDAAWGEPSMSLKIGAHHIYFLASYGTTPTQNGTKVTWASVRDTFWADYEVSVVSSSNGNRAVTLDRVTSLLALTIDDAIPDGATTLTATPGVWYNGIDIVGGVPVAATSGKSWTSLASNVGQTGRLFGMYLIGATEEYTTDIQLQATDGQTVIGSATLTDVPVKRNRKLQYHGPLFGRTANNSVKLNTDWLDDYNGQW